VRITANDARTYWAHHSQQEKSAIMPDDLPDSDDFQYWARDGVCGVFHRLPWPDVWMAHYGVKPEAWGRTTKPARAVINEFWEAEQPALLTGWTLETNRAALSFARRIGFTEIGRMNLESGAVIMQEYRQC